MFPDRHLNVYIEVIAWRSNIPRQTDRCSSITEAITLYLTSLRHLSLMSSASVLSVLYPAIIRTRGSRVQNHFLRFHSMIGLRRCSWRFPSWLTPFGSKHRAFYCHLRSRLSATIDAQKWRVSMKRSVAKSCTEMRIWRRVLRFSAVWNIGALARRIASREYNLWIIHRVT